MVVGWLYQYPPLVSMVDVPRKLLRSCGFVYQESNKYNPRRHKTRIKSFIKADEESFNIQTINDQVLILGQFDPLGSKSMFVQGFVSVLGRIIRTIRLFE